MVHTYIYFSGLAAQGHSFIIFISTHPLKVRFSEGVANHNNNNNSHVWLFKVIRSIS